jgi:hypothetical protein
MPDEWRGSTDDSSLCKRTADLLGKIRRKVVRRVLTERAHNIFLRSFLERKSGKRGERT